MKIGVDLGGSHIGVGLIDGENILKMLDKNLTREDRVDIENTIINEIHRMIIEILMEMNVKIEDIEYIGIASPGTIQNGTIVKAGNLGLKNFEIVKRLQEKIKLPIYIRNDGKAAALAEKKYGAMEKYDDCLFLCLGTGIGGAVFMGGKLLEPKRYSGFELGHMVVNKGGRPCTCGKYGCFETYASIKTLRQKVAEKLDIDSDFSGQYLREEILKNRYEELEDEVEIYTDYLKEGIANLIDIFEPEVICLGGSFAYWGDTKLYERFLEKLNAPKATFNDMGLPKIVLAEFRNNAGIVGATIIE